MTDNLIICFHIPSLIYMGRLNKLAVYCIYNNPFNSIILKDLQTLENLQSAYSAYSGMVNGQTIIRDINGLGTSFDLR